MGNLSTIDAHHYNKPIHNLQSQSDDVIVDKKSGGASNRDEEVVPKNTMQRIGNTVGSNPYIQSIDKSGRNNRGKEVVPNNTVHRMGNKNKTIQHNHPNHIWQPKSDDPIVQKSQCTSNKDKVDTDSYRFGLRALADVLNGTDTNVNALAVGRDKEILESYDNMYCTHNFPWSARIPNPPPQYKLPSCYLSEVPRLNVSLNSFPIYE